jgi:hypothetical protein
MINTNKKVNYNRSLNYETAGVRFSIANKNASIINKILKQKYRNITMHDAIITHRRLLPLPLSSTRRCWRLFSQPLEMYIMN